jgi:hypothetical protein
MNLIRIAVLSALTLQLSGCWFIFIPGSVTAAVSDSITGAEGSNCVGVNAKVGDKIRLPGGGVGTVKSLSGTSMRCTQPELPIRALLAFDSAPAPTLAPAKKNCDLIKDANGESKLVCP